MRRELMKPFTVKGSGFLEADLDRAKPVPLSAVAADPDGTGTIRATFARLDQTIENDSTREPGSSEPGPAPHSAAGT